MKKYNFGHEKITIKGIDSLLGSPEPKMNEIEKKVS